MTKEELAEYSNVKLNTVKRNLFKIAGVTDKNMEIPDGSRYPYNVRRNKLDNMEKRVRVILDATFRCQYVDEKKLHLPENEFKMLLDELVKADLLQANGSSNQYGANMYSTTLKYEYINKMKKKERIKLLSDFTKELIGLSQKSRNSSG